MTDTTEPTAPGTTSDAIIRKWATVAAGVGLIPLPIVDMAGLIAVQVKMVADLSRHHGVAFSQNRGKALVGGLVGTLASRQLASGAAGSLFKMVPVIGQFGGMIAMSAFAAASTWAVGRVFEKHFASGGTLLDFSTTNSRDTLNAEFDRARARS